MRSGDEYDSSFPSYRTLCESCGIFGPVICSGYWIRLCEKLEGSKGISCTNIDGSKGMIDGLKDTSCAKIDGLKGLLAIRSCPQDPLFI